MIKPPMFIGLLHQRVGYFDALALNNTDDMELFVFSNETLRQIILVARLDNLGKGASGAAVQNLNLMLNKT